MYFVNGGINTFFLFGFAENDGDDLLLHTTASSEAALRVVRQGAREADYPFEPVILVGSMLMDDLGQPYFIARLTLSASKRHVPRQLKWRLGAYGGTMRFEPIDLANRFRLRPEILEPLPDTVAWPDWVVKLARREGGELEAMLEGAVSQKKCWGLGLVAGFARLTGVEDPDSKAPEFLLDFRLRPSKDAIPFATRLSAAVRGGREIVSLIRRRNPLRSPVTLLVRPMLAAKEGEPQGWVLRIEEAWETSAGDLVDAARFLGRGQTDTAAAPAAAEASAHA